MEDVTKLQAQKDALVSENTCLKDVIRQDKDTIDNLVAHVQAYSQTVNEVISGSISLKAGSSRLEKTVAELQSEGTQKDEQLKAKDAELAALKAKLEELENQVPAKKVKA